MKKLQTIFVTILLGVLIASCASNISAPIKTSTMTPGEVPSTPTSLMPTATYFPSSTPTKTSEGFPTQPVPIGKMIGVPLYSSNGKWLLIWAKDRIFILDSRSYQLLRSLAVASDNFTGFATLSSDGKTLMLGNRLIAMDDGVELSFPKIPPIMQIDNGSGAIESGKFSPDNTLLAVGYYVDRFDIWQMNSGKLLYSVPGQSIVFSPNSRWIAVKTYSNENKHIRLYEAETGSVLKDWIAERAEFLNDDQVAVETDGATRVYDLVSGKVPYAFTGRYAAFSPKKDLIALLYFNRVEIRRLLDGELVAKIEDYFDNLDVFDLHFSADEKTLLGYAHWSFCCAGSDQRLFLWHVDDGSLIKATRNFGPYSFSSDGSSLAVMTDNDVEIWNSTDGSVQIKLSEIAVP